MLPGSGTGATFTGGGFVGPSVLGGATAGSAAAGGSPGGVRTSLTCAATGPAKTASANAAAAKRLKRMRRTSDESGRASVSPPVEALSSTNLEKHENITSSSPSGELLQIRCAPRRERRLV